MPHRCYVPVLPAEGEVYTLDGDEAHHLIRVLRCKTGDAVELMDGRGGMAEATVAQLERRQLELTVSRVTKVPLAEQNSFSLIQAVPKGKRQDLVLQKAVELGVHHIVFVQTEHVVSRVRPGEQDDKIARWEQILVSGLKQSGNPWLPTLEFSDDWASVVEKACATHDRVFLADLSPDAKSLKTVLQELPAGKTPALACCIGPEGDFSPKETQFAREAGCIPVNLGPRVLRTETAALYLMSVFAYEFLN